MADLTTSIDIIARADPAPVDRMDKSIAQLQKDLRAAKKELNEAAPGSAAFDAAGNKIIALTNRITELRTRVVQMAQSQQAAASQTAQAADKIVAANERVAASATKAQAAQQGTAPKGGNSAQSLLYAGQAIEDAQYGISGVINNMPLLLGSLGLGVGAVGALQIAFVALNQLLPQIQAGIAALNGEVEGMKSLGDLGFDEANEKRLRDSIKLLDDQTAAMQRRRDAADSLSASVDHMRKVEEEMLAIEREQEDADFISSGNPILDARKKADIAQERLDKDYLTRQETRQKALDDLVAKQREKEQEVDQKAAAEKAQRDRIAGIQEREALEKDQAALAESLKKKQADLARLQNVFGPGGEVREAQLAKEYRDQEALYNSNAEKLARLPKLPAFEGADAITPGGRGQTAQSRKEDVEKAQAKQKEVFEREKQQLDELTEMRKRAEDAAIEARNALQSQARANVFDEQNDLKKTNQQRQQIESKVGGEIASAATAQDQERGNDDASGALTGINDLAGRANNSATKQKLEELTRMLTDSDGATAADLEQVKSALTAMQVKGGVANQQIASVLNQVASAQEALAGGLQSLNARLSAVEAQARNIPIQ